MQPIASPAALTHLLAMADENDAGPSGKGARARRRILVVDDEPILLAVVRRVLAADYEVVTLERAEDALALVLAGDRFDLILCDLMMPGMDGMELRAELNARVPDQAARFLFMTGGAFTAATREFLETMANDRVEKPFEPEHLRALIAERLG